MRPALGACPAQRAAAPAAAPRNWRLACTLIVLVAIPTLLGLALTGLRVTGAARNAQAYSQVSHLAGLGQQVSGLTQAMEGVRGPARPRSSRPGVPPRAWRPCTGST